MICCVGIRDEYRNTTEVFSLARFSEEQMLKQLLDKVSKNEERYFVGWNIKNPEFGLSFLAKRYAEIKGKEIPEIPEDRVVDLDEVIQNELGKKLTMKQIAEINGYTTLHFRDGKEELDLFNAKDYKALELSVGRKVKIIGDVLRGLINGNLLVEPRPDEKGKSKKRIFTLVFLMIVFAFLDFASYPFVEFYIIALVGAEIAFIAGLPKIIEYFFQRS
jgi:hypothetical protein